MLHENKMLVIWLAVNDMRHQQKLIFLFYVKKHFLIKKRKRQKLLTLFINQIVFSFEMRKYASFAELNLILWLLQKRSYCRLIVSWNMRYPSTKFRSTYLLKHFTLIKALIFLITGPAKWIWKCMGPWKTDKYCRPPWLGDQKSFWILDVLEWLKQ